MAEYIIGIDLGTTNCVLAYIKKDEENPEVKLLEIPQLVDRDTVESRYSLPSFLFLAQGTSQGMGTGLKLPWSSESPDYAVGELARRESAVQPKRTVLSAKSWLCNNRLDRHTPILPPDAPDDFPKISPVMATMRYLEHMVSAWNDAFPEAPFIEQDVVLTVPASFDASARELTHSAALDAGFPDSMLLMEEPLAAVYAWISDQKNRWRKTMKPGDTLLICDVGGGTTDLSLVCVKEEQGELVLERLAVGNHLLVGGDNMDLATAYYVAGLLEEKGVHLDPWQSVSLQHSCRNAKEDLLSLHGQDVSTITAQGRGSRLMANTAVVDISRDVLQKLLVDGFFPLCDISDRPKRNRVSGFQQMGLPYESDTAITHHVAAFLTDHGAVDGSGVKVPVLPTHLLFNGGVFKSEVLRQRMCAALDKWSGGDGHISILEGTHDLDYAVARGAAHYGYAKSHGGTRIRGGIARSYYVGIETSGLAIPGAPRPLHALCVAPFGMEEGTETDVPSDEIGLVIGENAKFRIFSSLTRKKDRPGDFLTHWSQDELEETDSLEMFFPADGTEEYCVPVRFFARVTELGLFELWCVSTLDQRKWKLEFSVRDTE